MEKTIIVWFRKDLRVHDNPALWEAVHQGIVIPVFIWSPEEEWDAHIGKASSWWLYHSLIQLQQSFYQLNSMLVFRKGPSFLVLQELIRETGAQAIYFNERYEPLIQKRDKLIQQQFLKQSIEVKTFKSQLLFEPNTIVTQQGQPYKVFTPFWKQCLKEKVGAPLPIPSFVKKFQKSLRILSIDELAILPSSKCFGKFSSFWTPGEYAGKGQWRQFLDERLEDYQSKRDFPYSNKVSRISPYLTWGDLSPKWVWHTIKEKMESERTSSMESKNYFDSFMKQLIWREFAYHQMVSFPRMTKEPLRSEFLSFPWEDDEESFKKWQRGVTGYPFIDAGMRELWETGWLHNRARMAVSSFLVKHLLISWVKGAAWFEGTLLDADLANNSMGWQWILGSGFDASPYFRIFNPITQGEKFDPKGEYIRCWVPELAELPDKYIHKPWKAPKETLEKLGIQLGSTYPYPIIDHPYARERALYVYKMIK